MSRSRRKIPFSGITTARSEKYDKQKANRAFRKATKLGLIRFREDKPLPVVREVSNVWSMAKDGKKYFDPIQFPKIMRK